MFWDLNINFFGYVGSIIVNRGEFFLFWNFYKLLVFIVFVVGEVVNKLENVFDEIIVGSVIVVLKGIFGSSVVF